MEFPLSSVDGSVADRWGCVVDGADGGAALRSGAVRLTHAELDQRARALAGVLAPTPSRPDLADEPVAVLTDHDESVVVACLGVLLSGRPLVALDPRTPLPRLSAVVEASGARLCVTGPQRAPMAEELQLVPVPLDQPAAPDGQPLPRPEPGATATVIFTSGSTGRPQGVAYSHRTVLTEAWRRAETGSFRPEDSFALVLPAAFAFGAMELVSTLLVGASVTVHDPRAGGLEAVVRQMAEVGTTLVSGTPSLLRAVADVPGVAGLLPPTLRGVRSAGERLLTADAAAITAVLPDGCALVNTMGSSETGALTECVLDAAVLAGGTSVPLGWPFGDLDLRVEREDGSPAGTGEAGELVVVSRGLPTGYWRDPAGTAERFEDLGDGRTRVGTRDRVRRREDGCLELLGRMGLMVKVRGHRVDPAEVEAALLSADGVAQVVVVGLEGDEGGGRGSRTRLVAHVVPEQGVAVRPSELRAHARSLLPAAMVPDVVVLLTALPRTERGKVDRAALPAPTQGATEAYAEPRGDWERVLVEMWGFVLEVHGLGRHDDFFALGGDSLDAEHLVSRLRDLGVDAETADLVAAPTVAQFAQRHPRHRTRAQRRRATRATRAHGVATAGPPVLVPVDDADGADAAPRLFCLAGAGGLGLAFLPLARRLAGTATVHALQAHRLETGGLPDWTVARIVRRHAAAIRAVQPHGPYHLAGHSLGGLLALEVAHLLRAAGEEVALVVVIDSYAPGHHPPPPPTTWRVKARTAAGLALTGLATRDDRGHFPRFRQQGVVLGRRIVPRAWDGPTLVIVAADEPLGGRDVGWSECLTGPWQTQVAPGTHLTVLREPSAGVVADAVARALDDLPAPGADRRVRAAALQRPVSVSAVAQ